MELSTTQKKLKMAEAVKTKGIVAILEYIYELQERLEQEIPSVKNVIERMKGDKGDSPTKNELVELIKPLIPEVEDGKPGDDYVLTSQDKAEIASQIKVPVVKQVVKEIVREVPVVNESSIALKASKLAQEEVKPLIPTIKPLEANIAQNSRDIVELFELIEKLSNEIKRLIEVASSRSSGTKVIGASVGGDRVKIDDVSSQCNGSNRDFYLEKEPNDTRKIMVWGTQFPIILRPTIDFTVSRKVLTLTSEVAAPATGQTLIVQYTF